jgi:hypothetical protein
MSAPIDPKNDDIHPLAKPFLFLDNPKVKAAPFYIFLFLALALLVVEFVHPRHAYGKWEEIFGFYEIEGFFGFCLAVLSGWPLRWLLARDADYYATPEELAERDALERAASEGGDND